MGQLFRPKLPEPEKLAETERKRQKITEMERNRQKQTETAKFRKA